MRKILIVALILYNFVAQAIRPGNYDYDDVDVNKRHALLEERRNWRKKVLSKNLDDHKDYDRFRHEYDTQRYIDEQEQKAFNTIERQRMADRDLEMSAPSYRTGVNRGNHYDVDNNIPQMTNAAEREGHPISYMIDKEHEKKPSMISLNCDRPHERYEACFAGCASVTCDNPRDRLQPCYPFCESGCICIPPYVRDDRTHKCVLPDDCTKGLKGIPDIGEDI